MKKIAFINPQNTPTTDPSILIEPIDILQIATTVRGYGCEVKVYDRDNNMQTEKQRLDDMKVRNPDICVVIFDYHIPLHIENTYNWIIDFAKAYKELQPHTQIYVWWKMATYMPEKFIYDMSPIDCAIAYDLEEPLHALAHIQTFDSNSISHIDNISFRTSKWLTRTTIKKKPMMMTDLPIPDRSLVDISQYIDVRTMLSSRGCMLKCSFCHVPGFRWRRQWRNPEQIGEEIAYLAKEYDTKKILFLDDNATADPKRLHAICDVLIAQNNTVALWCLSTIHSFDNDLMQHMYAAGFRWIHYGVETANEKVSQTIHKHLQQEKIRHAIQQSKNIWLRVRTSRILDLPTTTQEHFDQTIQFIKELQTDEIRLHFLALRLGSEMYDQYVDETRDLPQQYIHHGSSSYNFHSIPKEYMQQQIQLLIDHCKNNNYELIQNIHDNTKCTDDNPKSKFISLCPLKYGIQW